MLTVTLVTRIAEHMLTTPAEAKTFFLILVPPISPPITKAFVIAHLPKNCVNMMLAMMALTALVFVVGLAAPW